MVMWEFVLCCKASRDDVSVYCIEPFPNGAVEAIDIDVPVELLDPFFHKMLVVVFPDLCDVLGDVLRLGSLQIAHLW